MLFAVEMLLLGVFELLFYCMEVYSKRGFTYLGDVLLPNFLKKLIVFGFRGYPYFYDTIDSGSYMDLVGNLSNFIYSNENLL